MAALHANRAWPYRYFNDPHRVSPGSFMPNSPFAYEEHNFQTRLNQTLKSGRGLPFDDKAHPASPFGYMSP